MRIQEDIRAQNEVFKALCINHNVRYLFAFGSSTTKDFDPINSDIDLLVEIESQDPIERGENLINLWDKFEVFFNRKVDLLTESSIKNQFLRESIDKTKILIYDGKGQKILV
jgi:uncharacterized protein